MKPFFIFSLTTVLASCANNRNNLDPIDYSGLPDTAKLIITTTFTGTTYPQIFEAAFHKGTKTTEGTTTLSFATSEIGNIKIESGKIIASDPILMHDAKPFIHRFPTGEFPVQLAMAFRGSDERVAFSQIKFSDNPVVKWEFALHEGQQPTPIDSDSGYYCFSVDAGMALFTDSVANQHFLQKGESEWKKVFMVLGRMGYVHNFDNHSLATFTTGWGDGCYSTYIGLDSAGNICRLLADFGMVTWWNTDKK